MNYEAVVCNVCDRAVLTETLLTRYIGDKKYVGHYECVNNVPEPPTEDIVNHPTHYHQNGIDVIGFSELQFSKEELKGFYRINVLKYVTRYDRKGGAEDLKKAEFYLNKLKELAQ